MQNMAPPPPPQMTNVPPAVTQAVVVNPTPADEQRRLEAVASEVARRRALREQASQQVNTPPSVPMAQPQPPQIAAQPFAVKHRVSVQFDSAGGRGKNTPDDVE